MTNLSIVRRLLLAAATALVLPACHSGGGGGGGKAHSAAAAPAEFVSITIDGDTSEWPEGVAAYADEHYLYLRFTVQGEQETIQASNKSICLLIDADASTSTGYVSDLSPMNELGVDLELQFSPPGPTGVPLRGMRLSALDGAGNRSTLSKEDYDVVFSPTYASSWYEVRICRTPDSKQGLPPGGLLSGGQIRCMATFADPAGAIVAYSDPSTVQADPVCVGGRRMAAFAPPAKPADAVRVVSWNIEKSKPVASPDSFARILVALQPDVVLLQEWETGDAGALQNWFDQHVPGNQPWNVRKAAGDMTNGGGVAVVSRFPMTAVLGDSLFATYKDDEGKEKRSAVRSVAANLDTPHGKMLALSTHLKSGGSKDSVEDRRHMAEAWAINTTFAAVGKATEAPLRVIGGDMNLVGSRPPIDVLRAGLDADGSDLTPMPGAVHGDQAFYTWRDAKTAFGPGRLDWIVYSDATAHAVNAFVFDASRLTDDELTSMGLKREDANACDHLPSVLDLVKGAAR